MAERDVPDPPPPGVGEIQVRIEARGVQYVDVLMLAGKYQFRPEPPFIPGGEAAGQSLPLGLDVSGFAVGDRVMSRHTLGALRNWAMQRRSCATRCQRNGMAAAGVFRGAYTTAYHALLQRGRLSKGNGCWCMAPPAASA